MRKMEAIGPQIDLPASWREGLAAAARRQRVLVLGPTDVGKTTFIRIALEEQGAGRLIDLDPGQKMVGPPGTVGRGTLERLERLIFIGTTSASALSAIARAANALADGPVPFIVNTSGFVKGPGARLQAMTVSAIQPDLIVEIGSGPIVAPPPDMQVLRLEPSPLARRKSAGFRASLRQAAFDRELDGSSLLVLENVKVDPAPPDPWETPARPVCSLADGDGRDMALGIVEAASEGAFYIRARTPPEPVRLVRLGKMWAEPKEGRWRLLDRLQPSWGKA
jgi:polynucleotide 5'-hydroxyl-kinase GRC3/NOL9